MAPRCLHDALRCMCRQDGDAGLAHAREHPNWVLAASPSRVPCLLLSKERAGSRMALRLRGFCTGLGTGPRDGDLHPLGLEEE